jgi:hypothetical protein
MYALKSAIDTVNQARNEDNRLLKIHYPITHFVMVLRDGITSVGWSIIILAFLNGITR